MKRFVFCIALFLLICSLFSTKIVGVCAKLALKVNYDCGFAYRSLVWEEGQLVFSDLVLFDRSFHTHIEKASFRFDWSVFPQKLKAHITIDGPHLSVLKERQFPKSSSNWFDFSLSVNNGILNWGGQVHFSLDHDANRSQMSLDWVDASALLTLQGGKLEAQLNRFKIILLKPWIPYGEVQDGSITGRIVMDLDGNPLSANLKIAYGAISLPLSGIDGLQGSFSYNAGLGTKWELFGFGKAKGDLFPFSCTGRRHFDSQWLHSEIRFDESFCKVSEEKNWEIECGSLSASETTWIQGALSAIWPEISAWSVDKGTLTGQAVFGSSNWNAHIQAEDMRLQKGDYTFSCESAVADLTQEGGSFILKDPEYDLKFAGMWKDWNAEARIGQVYLSLNGGWDGEKLPIHIEKGSFADLQFHGDGWIDPELDAYFSIAGEWDFLQKKIPFYCPRLSKEKNLWAFDFRCSRNTWDIFRFAGTYDGKNVDYQPTSHLLGQPIYFAKGPVDEIDLSLQMPWKALLAAGPFLSEWGIDLEKITPLERTDIQFGYKDGKIEIKAKGNSPPFRLYAVREQEDWEIDLASDLNLSAHLKKDGSAKGHGKWKEEIETQFEGKIDPSLFFEFSLSNTSCDLKTVDLLKMEGKATGGGHIIYNGEIEADFDFNVSSLVINSFPLENEEQIHLFYSSKKGALLRGLHLHGEFDCIVDLLEYDLERSHWIFHNAQIYLPSTLLTHRFLQILDKDRDLNFTANLDFASDFSTFVCTMREGFIPYDGAYHHIENLDLFWKGGKCSAALYYLDHLFRVNLQIDDKIQGRLIVGDERMPLTIDWEYSDTLFIQSIEGAFSGIDASFHAENPNVLVGSAHLNFTKLSPLLPVDVAQVFDEIKMGQGYELKGRFKIEKNLPYFQGILSGKSIELFGFQFRTLLAQADFGPEKIRIFDIKISDSAGMMKIDEILIEDKAPWTILIPNLGIYEMRPSLLVRPGRTAGPINPLVVRELKITDFKGILDDGKTYTGKGHLHFINSYKRGESVFDLPANVLSRIVGLDLDLLIPVTGDLTFEIRDGYFNLLELSHAYSEGERSEFFLEMDPPPRMDLDGNLQIFIKMKQFVLLKITESFLISIDGALDDPQFRLKKKRFFGLM